MSDRTTETSLAIMVALLLAATFLRFSAWRDAPPGLRYDEMTVVYEADEIRAGARPIYMDGSAEEALYHYFVAAAEDVFGAQLFTLRWVSAAFSLIAVAATFALGRRMFNARVGVLACDVRHGIVLVVDVRPPRLAHHRPACVCVASHAVFVARAGAKPARFLETSKVS